MILNSLTSLALLITYLLALLGVFQHWRRPLRLEFVRNRPRRQLRHGAHHLEAATHATSDTRSFSAWNSVKPVGPFPRVEIGLTRQSWQSRCPFCKNEVGWVPT